MGIPTPRLLPLPPSRLWFSPDRKTPWYRGWSSRPDGLRGLPQRLLVSLVQLAAGWSRSHQGRASSRTRWLQPVKSYRHRGPYFSGIAQVCKRGLGLPDRKLQWRTSSCRSWGRRLLCFLPAWGIVVGYGKGEILQGAILRCQKSPLFFGSWASL